MEKIKVENTKPMKIAYIEHIGAYSEVPYDEYMNRLLVYLLLITCFWITRTNKLIKINKKIILLEAIGCFMEK